METVVSCEIVLVAPPSGIGFCLQKGRDQLVGYTVSDGADILFRFDVRVRKQQDGSPNFLGGFAQGRPAERFVYVCIGRRAGQPNVFVNGRAKVPFAGVDWTTIERVAGAEPGVLVARYAATGRSGAPATGTVPLLDGGWHARLEA